jgi:hypothetical protein
MCALNDKYPVDEKFVRILCDVHCAWKDRPPVYRAYVNNELFTERTWIWRDQYLEEAFQIQAPPGKYMIRYELLDPQSAEIRTTNWRVDWGPARVIQGSEIEIMEHTE